MSISTNRGICACGEPVTDLGNLKASRWVHDGEPGNLHVLADTAPRGIREVAPS